MRQEGRSIMPIIYLSPSTEEVILSNKLLEIFFTHLRNILCAYQGIF